MYHRIQNRTEAQSGADFPPSVAAAKIIFKPCRSHGKVPVSYLMLWSCSHKRQGDRSAEQFYHEVGFCAGNMLLCSLIGCATHSPPSIFG